MRKLCLFLLLSFSMALTVHAQDPYFSQPFASPLTLNPALTGKINGSWRLIANYRDQWPTIPKAYVTTAASFDLPVLKKYIPEGDLFGVGFSGLADATSNNSFKQNYISASLSYHKKLDENGYYSLGAGFQGTYVSTNLNTASLVFEDQLTSEGFGTSTTGEYLGSSPITGKGSYYDLNAGVLLSGTTNGNNTFCLGYSLYHINSPDWGLRSDNTLYGSWKIGKRSSIHGNANIALGDRTGINVNFVHQTQYKSKNTILGGAFIIRANDDVDNPTNVMLGAWTRINDALIPYCGLDFRGLKLAFTYDKNFSDVKTATGGNGGYEVSLIYTKRSNRDDYYGTDKLIF